MSVVVINHLHFSVPVVNIAPDVERAFPPAFEHCAGFERFYFVQTAENRATVLIAWESAEAAAAGAAAIGPTVFASLIAPRLASEQDRSMGEVLVTCGPGSS